MLFDLAVLGALWYLTVPPAVAHSRRHADRLDREGSDAQRWLEEHLGDGTPVPVVRTRWNVFGDRIHFTLPTGESLHLSCFWPRPVEVVLLRRAFFHGPVGWVLDGEVANGDRARFFAWRVRVQRS